MTDPTQPTDDDRALVDAVRRQVEEAEARRVATPERIGDYRIIRLLGQGGMGIVYEAEQQNPRRMVALKVLRTGILSAEMLRRFEKEAQALGRLHHVGIAQIYEGGTAVSDHDLQPFFVMEIVDGLPLTDYCEVNKLTVKARLGLLAKVCDAIEHAHQSKVIHRDLKPSNILVDASGQPKILDFGVARVTEANVQTITHKTEARRLIGTLPYMSPEQIRGEPRDIDARSDVYALGVLAFRVLAGRYPYHIPRYSLPNALRAIQEDEPIRLSLLNRELRGDVETIVLKALEKEPQRRYASAAALAEDLRRYLKEEPIRARPASSVYRFRKFARRNKALVSGMTGVILALALGLFVSTRAYRLADRRLEDLRRLADARDLVLYRAEAAELWPAHPRNIASIEAWIAKAGKLRPRRDEYKRHLTKLHERSVEFKRLQTQDRIGLRHAEELREVREQKQKLQDKESAAAAHKRVIGLLEMCETKLARLVPRTPDRAFKDRADKWRHDLLSLLIVPLADKLRGVREEQQHSPEAESEADAERRQRSIRQLEESETILIRLVSRTHDCEFEDRVDKLQHDVLAPLVQDLDDFFHPSSGVYEDVRIRLVRAREMDAAPSQQDQTKWTQAIASIADTAPCPQCAKAHVSYREAVSRECSHESRNRQAFPLVGMVPLDRDPNTGLWEFVDIETGEIPKRDQNGRLIMTEEAGLVFVLIPGGHFTMGARPPAADYPRGSPNVDPRAAPDERPDDHDVLLDPFLLSKFEMTESQSRRVASRTLGSPYPLRGEFSATGTGLLPITNISWDECDEMLWQLDLTLPTEAQWEYAARAGSTTPWWTGEAPDFVRDAGNLAHDAPTAIGSAPANAFGLHDVIGNVAEWCLDAYGSYDLELLALDGKRPAGRGLAGQHVIRGGSFRAGPVDGRSSARHAAIPQHGRSDLGVRPARRLYRDD